MPFTIQWQDDEKDWNVIEDEVSLIDAIDFFQSGEEGSVSSGSVFSSRSSSRHPKITVFVEICVDYDGPSLSETSSVREGDSPEGSQVSFLPGELSSSSQDDDAVTVSSKDTRAPRAKAKVDSSLFKKILNGTSRSAGSSSSSKQSLKPSRSRIFNLGSRASSAEEGTTTGNLTDSYPDDHLAVFERLKLEEQRRPPSVHDRPILETDRGKAWLQNQNTMQKAILGVVPSMSDDTSSLNDSPFSDGNSDMGISLQRDKRGKLYYNLTSFGSSESAGDLEYEFVNGTQPSKPHVPRFAPFLNSHLQATPRTIFTSFCCPKWLQTAQNVGLSLTSLSTFAQLAGRRRPCHVLRLRQRQRQPVWERARVVPPPPITTIVGIVLTMNYKGHPTHPAHIATQSHCILPAPTCPYTRRTPSPYQPYLLTHPHKQYLAKALAPNRHWFLQARQDLHPRQRALDMSFVIPASKRSVAITHCLSVWTVRNYHQHPKNLQSLVEAPLRKGTYDTRSCSRYGGRASMVGRTSVISLSFCSPRSGELNKHGMNRTEQSVGSMLRVSIATVRKLV